MAEPSLSSKEQRAYHAIKERIVSGEYGPGARLVLDQLARDLSVSVVPVREAIRRLEAEGWVTFRRNVGAHVATIDSGEYRDAMQSLALLEGFATAEGAATLDGATLKKAARLNEKMRTSLRSFDPLGFTGLNHEFHVLVCSGCPNAHLRALLQREWQRLNMLRRTTFSLVPGRAQESVDEHEKLLGLITSGARPATIEKFARQHKLNTLRAVISH